MFGGRCNRRRGCIEQECSIGNPSRSPQCGARGNFRAAFSLLRNRGEADGAHPGSSACPSLWRRLSSRIQRQLPASAAGRWSDHSRLHRDLDGFLPTVSPMRLYCSSTKLWSTPGGSEPRSPRLRDLRKVGAEACSQRPNVERRRSRVYATLLLLLRARTPPARRSLGPAPMVRCIDELRTSPPP